LQIAINIQSLPYAVTKPRFCHFESLSIRRTADGDLMARQDMGREGDSMLSLTLIKCNFMEAEGLEISPDIAPRSASVRSAAGLYVRLTGASIAPLAPADYHASVTAGRGF
jgi:hypothetical protein